MRVRKQHDNNQLLWHGFFGHLAEKHWTKWRDFFRQIFGSSEATVLSKCSCPVPGPFPGCTCGANNSHHIGVKILDLTQWLDCPRNTTTSERNYCSHINEWSLQVHWKAQCHRPVNDPSAPQLRGSVCVSAFQVSCISLPLCCPGSHNSFTAGLLTTRGDVTGWRRALWEWSDPFPWTPPPHHPTHPRPGPLHVHPQRSPLQYTHTIGNTFLKILP